MPFTLLLSLRCVSYSLSSAVDFFVYFSTSSGVFCFEVLNSYFDLLSTYPSLLLTSVLNMLIYLFTTYIFVSILMSSFIFLLASHTYSHLDFSFNQSNISMCFLYPVPSVGKRDFALFNHYIMTHPCHDKSTFCRVIFL